MHGRRAGSAQVLDVRRRIVEQDALAALAHQHLLAALDVLHVLRPHCDVAYRTAAVDHFRHRRATTAADTLIVRVHAWVHSRDDGFARGLTLGEGRLIDVGPLAG